MELRGVIVRQLSTTTAARVKRETHRGFLGGETQGEFSGGTLFGEKSGEESYHRFDGPDVVAEVRIIVGERVDDTSNVIASQEF